MREADARVRRTRRVLHESLGSLIHERPYKDISVQEILERADVSRSTFYTHFEDKDALLVTSIAEICDVAAESVRRLPVAQRALGLSGPIFEHIAKRGRSLASSLNASACWAVHDLLRDVIERRVLNELRALDALSSRPAYGPRISTELRARHIAVTFITVLEWWLSSGSRLDAQEINAVFLRLARADE